MSQTNATGEPTAGHAVTRAGGARGDKAREAKRRVVAPHANKFVAATSVLVTIAIVALGAAYVIWHNDKHGGPAPAWSSWKPRDTGTAGAVDIANHVAPYYRISGTQQLNAITLLNVANPNTITNSTTGTPPNQYELAVGNQAGTGKTTSPVQLLGGKTIAFNLCGLGSGCSIGTTIPSSQRELLLRREGLELALYAFHYLKGIDNVAVVLPPATIDSSNASTLSSSLPSSQKGTSKSTQSLNLSLLFTRKELAPWTNARSLTSTLSAEPPVVPELSEWVQTTEASLVSQLTAETLFTDRIEHLADGTSLLVLDPAPPQ